MTDNPKSKVCDICGRKDGLKAFTSTSEEPDDIPIFCEMCFMSDECTSEEPMTKAEKAEEWIDAKYL